MITTSEKEPILIDLDASREVHLKRLYNCVVGQAFSTSGKYLFIANKCGDIFVQRYEIITIKNVTPIHIIPDVLYIVSIHYFTIFYV